MDAAIRRTCSPRRDGRMTLPMLFVLGRWRMLCICSQRSRTQRAFGNLFSNNATCRWYWRLHLQLPRCWNGPARQPAWSRRKRGRHGALWCNTYGGSRGMSGMQESSKTNDLRRSRCSKRSLRKQGFGMWQAGARLTRCSIDQENLTSSPCNVFLGITGGRGSALEYITQEAKRGPIVTVTDYKNTASRVVS